MSFPETVDEILDVSEDEGKIDHFINLLLEVKCRGFPFVCLFVCLLRATLYCAPLTFSRGRTANPRYELSLLSLSLFRCNSLLLTSVTVAMDVLISMYPSVLISVTSSYLSHI